MTDQLERLREARDQRAFRMVMFVLVGAMGWLIAFVSIASAVLKALR